jgi:hypothetical protein
MVMAARSQLLRKKPTSTESLIAEWNLILQKSNFPGPNSFSMKYIVVILFVALSTAALAQENEQQYKLDPDSLTTPFRIRTPLTNHFGIYWPHIKVNDPLYILDEKEIPYDELQKLDPNKLESIKVLRDSAATASYGKKGINGVVLLYSKPKKKD